MKLRMTGFEFSLAFVIRLGRVLKEAAANIPKDVGPAISKRVCLGISHKIDEFPNQLWCGYVFFLSNAKLSLLV